MDFLKGLLLLIILGIGLYFFINIVIIIPKKEEDKRIRSLQQQIWARNAAEAAAKAAAEERKKQAESNQYYDRLIDDIMAFINNNGIKLVDEVTIQKYYVDIVSGGHSVRYVFAEHGFPQGVFHPLAEQREVIKGETGKTWTSTGFPLKRFGEKFQERLGYKGRPLGQMVENSQYFYLFEISGYYISRL